jgi:hypothetical protein
VLRACRRLSSRQDFQQAPLLAKLSLDLLQGLEDSGQINTRATPALCLGLGACGL